MTLSTAQLYDLRARYNDGERTADLAAEAGVAPSTLRHHWRRVDVGFYEQVTDEEFARMWRMVDQGMTCDAVASELGRSVSTVQRLVGGYDPDADHHPLVISAAVDRCRRDGISAVHEATLLPVSTLRRWCRRAARC